MTVSGKGFYETCNDVAQNGQTPTISDPQKGIRIRFVQGSREWLLAKVDADNRFAFTVPVVVPRDARVGAALIQAGAAPTSRSSFNVTGLAETGEGALGLMLIGFVLVLTGFALWGPRGRDTAS